MANRKKDKCKVSVYVASGQEDLSERRILEGPKSIFVETPVSGTALMPKIHAEIGDTTDVEDSVEYTIVLTDLVPPGPQPSSWPRYLGSIYFVDHVRVPQHIYAEDLLHFIQKVLGIEKTSSKIFGINPIPKRGASVTNELVNQIREEMGI